MYSKAVKKVFLMTIIFIGIFIVCFFSYKFWASASTDIGSISQTDYSHSFSFTWDDQYSTMRQGLGTSLSGIVDSISLYFGLTVSAGTGQTCLVPYLSDCIDETCGFSEYTGAPPGSLNGIYYFDPICASSTQPIDYGLHIFNFSTTTGNNLLNATTTYFLSFQYDPNVSNTVLTLGGSNDNNSFIAPNSPKNTDRFYRSYLSYWNSGSPTYNNLWPSPTNYFTSIADIYFQFNLPAGGTDSVSFNQPTVATIKDFVNWDLSYSASSSIPTGLVVRYAKNIADCQNGFNNGSGCYVDAYTPTAQSSTAQFIKANMLLHGTYTAEAYVGDWNSFAHSWFPYTFDTVASTSISFTISESMSVGDYMTWVSERLDPTPSGYSAPVGSVGGLLQEIGQILASSSLGFIENVEATTSIFFIDCSGYAGMGFFSSSTLEALSCYSKKTLWGFAGLLFQPQTTFSSFFTNSFTKIKSAFPFNIFFGSLASVQSVASSTADLASADTIIHFDTGDWDFYMPIMTSSTVEDIIGLELKTKIFDTIIAFEWVGALFLMFSIML